MSMCSRHCVLMQDFFSLHFLRHDKLEIIIEKKKTRKCLVITKGKTKVKNIKKKMRERDDKRKKRRKKDTMT